ncbi:hypothetical protein [Micromonospora sp. KC721]|uniref:hypothetical protein n=1 Tax=Micromonospora sp. KC721 TaxID=2530380 RepID=UPI001FB8117F|nr:hypothetical protein [Micromonospora sp. KC721]
MDVEATLLFVLGAVAVVVAVRWAAERTGLPAAALLTVAGIGYAVLPGPTVVLNPEFVRTFVPPPLLYSAALGPIPAHHPPQPAHRGQPSVALVLLTASAVGLGFAWFVEGATLAPASR